MVLWSWLAALSGTLAAVPTATAVPPVSPNTAIIQIHRNGTVLDQGGLIARALAGVSSEARCEFDLPEVKPSSRGPAEEIPGIAVTRWDHGGIVYTQTVLLTGLAPDNSSSRVLIVQLTGENCSREYTDATAAFALTLGEQTVELEWRHGLVHALNLPHQPVVAAVEIGAEGVDEASGARLKFGGHMPPGTSGAMTIKIPLHRLEEEKQLNQLRDLAFDEEYRRVRREWKTRAHEALALEIHLLDH